MDVQKLNTVDTSRLLKLIENISNERAEKAEKVQVRMESAKILPAMEPVVANALPLPALGRHVNIWA